jgi:hypothetical protein
MHGTRDGLLTSGLRVRLTALRLGDSVTYQHAPKVSETNLKWKWTTEGPVKT